MKFRVPRRIPTLSRSEFNAYICEADSPLIITSETAAWPAMTAWSLDFFAQEFGDFPITAFAPRFPELATCGVRTTLGAHIDYLRDPSAGRVTGTWLKGDADELERSGLTLCASNFSPTHPVLGRRELIFRHVPETPPFLDPWFSLMEPAFLLECERQQPHHYVYLSAPGARAPVQQQFWNSHAFQAQIRGCTQVVLFHPMLADAIYSEPTGDVSKMMGRDEFEPVEAWRAELVAGDLLIIPSGWLHYSRTLELSVVYSANWADAANWRSYVGEAQAALASVNRSEPQAI